MLLQVKSLTLNYQDGTKIISAVKDVSLSLPEYGYYGICGPSGSGKSSLLYLLSGIKTPTSGDIIFNNAPFPKDSNLRDPIRKKYMGFVFQFHFLINYLNVLENILIGAQKINRETMHKAKDVIKRLDIDGLEKRRPYELSGGQRQRVAIARAIMNEPKILFVDEPTASLDHKSGKRVVELLKDISTDACVVAVTHDETILEDTNGVFRMWDGELKKSIQS